MGLCNFFRVVAGRANKAVQWPSNMSKETASQKHFSASTCISTTARHKRYQDFFEGYPLMLVDYYFFEKKLRNLEKWLCKTSNNISVKDFTTVAWLNLEKNVRQSHSARDCHACKLCIFDSLCSVCIYVGESFLSVLIFNIWPNKFIKF